MKPNEIPAFIAEVMEQVEIGIQTFANKKMEGQPEGSLTSVQFPEMLELQLNIEHESTYDDGTAAGEVYVEHQQFWVKIPWPTRLS